MKKRFFVQLVAICLLLSCGLFSQSRSGLAVETILDDWISRSSARDRLLLIGTDPIVDLASITRDQSKSQLRRSRALSLLATFPSPVSSNAVREIASDSAPELRCFALQASVELENQLAIPLLVSKLDDNAICLTKVQTDPPARFPIWVSDEAVRLLEDVTSTSFEKAVIGKHRATKPWKEWWSKQK